MERGPPDGYVMMTTPAGQERSRYFVTYYLLSVVILMIRIGLLLVL